MELHAWTVLLLVSLVVLGWSQHSEIHPSKLCISPAACVVISCLVFHCDGCFNVPAAVALKPEETVDLVCFSSHKRQRFGFLTPNFSRMGTLLLVVCDFYPL